MLYDLAIELICANSSEAKGRVERANQTLQDRLIKKMRLEDITGIEAANTWLATFIADFNSRFSRPAKFPKDLHRPGRILTTARYLKNLLSQKSGIWKRLYMRPVSHLGEDFQEFAGRFWGFVETRPHMRTKAALADALWESGNFYPAMAHCREMLKLNPSDNQGIRHLLANYYLELEMVDDLTLLLDEYSEDMR